MKINPNWEHCESLTFAIWGSTNVWWWKWKKGERLDPHRGFLFRAVLHVWLVRTMENNKRSAADVEMKYGSSPIDWNSIESLRNLLDHQWSLEVGKTRGVLVNFGRFEKFPSAKKWKTLDCSEISGNTSYNQFTFAKYFFDVDINYVWRFWTLRKSCKSCKYLLIFTI